MERIELPNIHSLYIPFPDNPKEIMVQEYKVHEYISPIAMHSLIRSFSCQVNLDWFDAIVVNQSGGGTFAIELAGLQKYGKVITDINYSRSGDIKIAIPEHLRGKRLGIVEDIYDSGKTAARILEHAPYSTFLFLTEKVEVEGQIDIPNRLSVVKIDDKYVGGFGMNIDTEGDGLPKDFLRDYPGIVSKII